ncbi:MAG: hypothetical protein WC515_06160 [Candidatus Omnitrophota bacterium]
MKKSYYHDGRREVIGRAAARVFIVFAVLLVSCPSGEGVIVTKTAPGRSDILKDSKSAEITVIDQVFLRADTIVTGAIMIKVLVNRLTNKVEYVWANGYGRYVRPEFVMPNVQELYNKTR